MSDEEEEFSFANLNPAVRYIVYGVVVLVMIFDLVTLIGGNGEWIGAVMLVGMEIVVFIIAYLLGISCWEITPKKEENIAFAWGFLTGPLGYILWFFYIKFKKVVKPEEKFDFFNDVH